MANTPKAERKWPDTAKAEWAGKILSGKVTFEDAIKELHVQSYQLWAWVGQYAYANLRKQPGEAQQETIRVDSQSGVNDKELLARLIKRYLDASS